MDEPDGGFLQSGGVQRILEVRGLSKAALWLQLESFAFYPALRAPPVDCEELKTLNSESPTGG